MTKVSQRGNVPYEKCLCLAINFPKSDLFLARLTSQGKLLVDSQNIVLEEIYYVVN